MTNQIIILNTNTQSNGDFSVSGVFWLVAPANRIVPVPMNSSQVPNVSATQLTLLQNGTLVEVPFSTGLYPINTVLADVQSDLQTQYTNAQNTLNNSAPPTSGFIGVAFDGTSWSTPSSPLNMKVQSVSLSGIPTASDGRINVLPTLFPANVAMTIVGAGDDPVNGNGVGTPFVHSSSDGYLTQHTVTWGHNDYMYLAGGQLMYSNAVIGDTVDYWVYAPATPVTGAGGTGNVSLTGPGNVLIIPGSNTNYSVDLTQAVPVPNVAGTGFWDWNSPASGVGKGTITSNLSQQGGYDLYVIPINLTHAVTAFQMSGTRTVDLIVPALIPRKVLPHWKHKVIVTNSGHDNLQLTWALTIARIKNT